MINSIKGIMATLRGLIIACLATHYREKLPLVKCEKHYKINT